MKIATTNGEKSIDELVDRLNGSDATNKTEFRERLLQDNPQLADVQNLPAGTPLVLAQDASGGDTALDSRVEGAYALARQTLVNTKAEIDAALQRENDSAAEGRDLLQSKDVQDAAGKNPDLAKQREDVLQRIAKAEGDRQTFAVGIASAITQFNAVLATPGRRRAVLPTAQPGDSTSAKPAVEDTPPEVTNSLATAPAPVEDAPPDASPSAQAESAQPDSSHPPPAEPKGPPKKRKRSVKR